MRTRDTLVFVKPERIRYVLEIISKHPNLGYMQLMKHSAEVTGGSFSHALKDAQIMGFVANGSGFHLTPLGERFLTLLLGSEEAKATLKQAYLNVPLFRQCFEELHNIKDYQQIRGWLLSHVNLREFEERLVGSATRRYIENIYGEKVEGRPRLFNRKRKQQIWDYANLVRNQAVHGGAGAGGGGGGGTSEAYLFEILKEEGYSEEELAAAEAALSSALSKDKAWKLLHRKFKR